MKMYLGNKNKHISLNLLHIINEVKGRLSDVNDDNRRFLILFSEL